MQEQDYEQQISYLNEKLNSCESLDKFFEVLKDNSTKDEFVFSIKYILEYKTDSSLLNFIIRKINDLRYKEFLPFLIDFILTHNFENKYLDLKVLAIKAISNFKDTSSVSALLYCLNDKNSNYKIRLASAEALGKIGDKNAFETLSNVACDDNERSTYIKESAVVALGMLGDERALDVFESILSTKQMFQEKFSYLKERIIEAIGKFDVKKDKKALSMLKKSLLDTSPHVRISAIEALMDSDFEGVYDLIKDRLVNDDDFEVKKNALVALYNISDRKILDEVLNEDYSAELKAFAVELIEEYEKESN